MDFESVCVGEVGVGVARVGVAAALAALLEVVRVEALRAAEANDAPLYCGEYGVIDRAPAEDALRWHADIAEVFNRYGIGRALWNYKNKDYGLVDAHYDGVRDALVKLL